MNATTGNRTEPAPVERRDNLLARPRGGPGLLDALREEAEALCRGIAPDLAGLRLYIVDRAAAFPDCRGGSPLRGCTMPGLDLLIRPHLEVAGRWRGRGLAILSDVKSIVDEFRGQRAAVHRTRRHRAIRAAYLGTVIHELAHILDGRLDLTDEPTGDYIEFERLVFEAGLSEEVPPIDRHPELPPWRGHEYQWIRTLVHLLHRARVAGVNIIGVDCATLREYELSPWRAYVEAIGDEPKRLAGESFATIRATTPPPALTLLWAGDIARWNKSKTDALALRERTTGTDNGDKNMLETLLKKLKVRKLEHVSDYYKTVGRLAAGEELSPEVVEEALIGAGKTPDALRDDVALRVQREKWASLVGTEDSVREEIATVDVQHGKATSRLEMAERRFNETAEPLEARRAALQLRLREIRAAKESLRQTNPRGELTEELQSARDKCIEASNVLAGLRKKVKRVGAAESDLQQAARATTASEADDWRAKSKRNRAAGEAAKAAIPDAEADLASASAEEEVIRLKLLTP